MACVLMPKVDALPVIWQSSVPAASSSRMIRDGSSNIYLATTSTSMLGRIMKVQKFNALGTLLWENEFVSTGNLGDQFRLNDIAINSDKLFVLFQERNNNGVGNFVSSRLRVLNTGNGSLHFGLTTFNTVWSAVRANELQVAVLGRSSTSQLGSVSFYNIADSAFAGVRSFGDVAASVGLALDADGNAFAAGINTTGNSITVVRCTSAADTWQVTLDDPNRTVEIPKKLLLDQVAGRVYVLGTGNHASTGTDVLVYSLNSSNGLGVATSVIGDANANLAGDISLVPAGGSVVSVVNPNDTQVVRLTSVGATLWSNAFLTPPTGTNRSHAYDVDGNVLVLAPAVPAGGDRVTRLNLANGTVAGSHLAGVSNETGQQLLTDSAGNFYVTTSEGSGETLKRSQVARLTFSANNVTGGTAVNGVITLPEQATSNQLWVLASGNASAASVPANVTLTAGNTTATFPVTVNGVTANTNVAINARFNGFITQTTLTLIPSNASAVVVNPNVVVGGVATQGTVTLTGKAPTGGRTVTLTSNKTNVATVPASVNVAAGQTSANFAITTFGVNANQGVVITATTGAVSKTAFFAVNAPSLTNLTVAPGSVKGGLNATATITINGIAPTGGFSIVLISGAPGLVILPANGIVPVGQTSVNVNVTTSAVTSSTAVTLFATRSGVYRTATLTVTP